MQIYSGRHVYTVGYPNIVPLYQNDKDNKTKTADLREFRINGTLLILLPYKASKYVDVTDRDRM
jgi:hypothetical protein